MESNELKEKIQSFCKRKHFYHAFVQECIAEFIVVHTNLFGDVVSANELLERLETNLDKITFVAFENAKNGELGEYKGRVADNKDINEIILYYSESELDLSLIDKKMWNVYTERNKKNLIQEISKRKAEIRSTLLHELTHAAYTIKGDYGIGEKHIFSETTLRDNISGEYRQVGTNNNNVEAIVNYISSRIEGKSVSEISTYKAETSVIYMLADIMDEKKIIQAAWNSDEQQFEQFYIEALGIGHELGEQSYNAFQNRMKKLVIMRGKSISLRELNKRNEQTLAELKQLFDGKTNEFEYRRFRDIEQPLQENLNYSYKEEKSLSFSQRIAEFLRNKVLLYISFVKKIVNKHLKLPSPAKEQNEINSTAERE